MNGTSRRLGVALFVGLTALLCAPRSAHAASHLWKIHELFSNEDGTVQYIVLHECCGSTGEDFVKNLLVESKTTGNIFKFPRDLTGSTAKKYLLLATQGYADLPGVPKPDFTIQASFFSTDADKIWYSEARNYDSYNLQAGALPLDGVHALRVTNYTTDASQVVDSMPINYAGTSGHVDLTPKLHDFVRGDCNTDGATDLGDAVYLLQVLFRGVGPLSCSDACEMNSDGALDVSDPIRLILFLFASGPALPEPSACGQDPSGDTLDCATFPSCP